MQTILGRPLQEALDSLPQDAQRPRVILTAAPLRPSQERRSGTPRVVACREGVWIAAEFLDQSPQEKEDS